MQTIGGIVAAGCCGARTVVPAVTVGVRLVLCISRIFVIGTTGAIKADVVTAQATATAAALAALAPSTAGPAFPAVAAFAAGCVVTALAVGPASTA